MCYVYFLVDSIYNPIRQDDTLLLAGIIGITEDRRKRQLPQKMLIESQKQTCQNLSIACEHLA
ncbi:MAG: hypothetical protein ACTS73_01475 [Arsenophonus sp. NEOnobi-MAG3]